MFAPEPDKVCEPRSLGPCNIEPAVWLGTPIMALWSFIGPSVNGMMSRHVGPSEQGQLQGANGSIMGVAGLIGPTIFTQLFAAAIAYAGTRYAGAPYLLAGVFLAFAGVIALRVTAASPNTPP